MTSSGVRAQPFWSSRSRAERIIKTVSAYAGFTPHEVSWAEFTTVWLADLKRDGFRVGVNWSGPRARGYDLEPDRLQGAVEAIIAESA
jgi:hypothetical protein